MKFILIIATVFAVYNILVHFGVFEIATRPTKVANEIETKRSAGKKRRFEQLKLNMYSTSVNMMRGIFMTDHRYELHEYYIQRLDLRSKVLDRQLTPEEVRGARVFPLLVSIIFIPLGFVKTIFFVIPVVAIANFMFYETIYKTKITDEDKIIDNFFMDLYLPLYSKLRQGSRARLQGTVENYVNTLETTKLTRESEVMLKLAKYILNLLALYEDHVAIPKLREIYHSATIINFCNVATQALQGIDNLDNLMTFKMQLVERRTVEMHKRQQKILAAGNRSIYAIWVILFIFIVVSWYSKIPIGAL